MNPPIASRQAGRERPAKRFDETARQVVALKCAAAAMRVKASPIPAYRPLPPLERLRALFVYRPETGELVNRVTRGGLRSGQVARLAAPERHGGYVTVYVDRVPFRAHRIAWKVRFGRDPVGQLDHVNGNRADNRIENLREVTPLENSRNRHTVRGKVSALGISLRRDGAFVADIGVGSRIVHLGAYDALECAIAARRYAESILFTLPGGDRRAA